MRVPLRVALVGCGEHAAATLLPALARIGPPVIEVVALCDLNFAAATSLAAQHHIGRVYSDAQAMLAQCPIDCVILCATPTAHDDLVPKFLNAGVHVFVEKPPASSLAALRRSVAVAELGNCRTQVGHNFRHTPLFRRLQGMLSHAPLRSPGLCVASYEARWPRTERWGCESVVHAFMLTHGIHLIDLLLFLFGPLRRFETRTWLDRMTGVLAITADGLHADGIRSRLHMSNGAPRFNLALSLTGQDCAAIRTQNFSTLHVVEPGDLREVESTWRLGAFTDGLETAGYLDELRAFFGAVASGVESGPTLNDELQVYEVLESIWNPVHIEFIDAP